MLLASDVAAVATAAAAAAAGTEAVESLDGSTATATGADVAYTFTLSISMLNNKMRDRSDVHLSLVPVYRQHQ